MRKNRQKPGTWLMAGGLLLIAAALLLTGYNLWDEQRAGETASRVLEQMPVTTEKPEPSPDADGNVFAYDVAEIQVLQSTAIGDMVSGEWDLSLFTCTLGGQTRLTVRCEKIENSG